MTARSKMKGSTFISVRDLGKSMLEGRKGFFTIDALFAFILLVSISGMLLNLAQSREQIGRSSSATLQADMVTEKLAAAINSVYANGGRGDNFELRIELPDSIGGKKYIIFFDNKNRKIFIPAENLGDFEAGKASASVVPGNVDNFLLDPENLSKTIKVYWVENLIRVMSVG